MIAIMDDGLISAVSARIRSHAASRDATATRGVIRIATAAKEARAASHARTGSDRISSDVRNSSSASVPHNHSLHVTRVNNPRH